MSGDYTVTGSKGSEDVRMLDMRLAAGKKKTRFPQDSL